MASSLSSSPAASRRKIGSRACDGCKIRKVRCSEIPPCNRCVIVGIECTFKKRQATRGPRSLQAKTLREIQEIQNQGQGQGSSVQYSACSPEEDGLSTDKSNASAEGSLEGREGESERAIPPGAVATKSGCQFGTANPEETPISSLIIRLCIYRLRLFPIWPIYNTEDAIACLLRNPHDIETYAVANAVSAATIAQLKLPFEGSTDAHDPASATSMAAECQRAKALLQEGDDRPQTNLNMLRISFFQHIYYENQSPGGLRSLLYLREAITMAQIMGLHHKSSDMRLPKAEQQMRRRILWLLFMTERGVAMLHNLPVILTCRPSLPPFDAADEADEAHILTAFKRLVNMFWILDQSKAFDMLQDSDGSSGEEQSDCFEYLQWRLQELPTDDPGHSNVVQKADACVTKSWMQAVLWRASMRRPRVGSSAKQASSLSPQPYCIAKEFLAIICRLPKSALEAHGPTMELKIFEIGNALMDALSTDFHLLGTSGIMSVRPVDMLIQLQTLLASSRGGNKTLLSLLCARIAEMYRTGSPEIMSSLPDYKVEGVEASRNNARWTRNQDQAFSVLEEPCQVVGKTSMRAMTPVGSRTLSYAMSSPVWFTPRQDLDLSMPDIETTSSDGMTFANAATELASESWAGWAVDFSGTSRVL